jgi:hypothetical protein
MAGCTRSQKMAAIQVQQRTGQAGAIRASSTNVCRTRRVRAERGTAPQSRSEEGAATGGRGMAGNLVLRKERLWRRRLAAGRMNRHAWHKSGNVHGRGIVACPGSRSRLGRCRLLQIWRHRRCKPRPRPGRARLRQHGKSTAQMQRTGLQNMRSRQQSVE